MVSLPKMVSLSKKVSLPKKVLCQLAAVEKTLSFQTLEMNGNLYSLLGCPYLHE